MPIRQPNPFLDPTVKKEGQVNPFVVELQNENLPVFYGPKLEARVQCWFPEQDHHHRKLIVEIGSYKGKTLVEMASDHPDYHFVGIDITFKRVVFAAKRALKHGLVNISSVLAHMNPQSLMTLFAPEQIDGVFIFFPDPWSKKRQRKNRLINAEFCRGLHSRLHKNGRVWFKTDHEEYFHEACAILANEGFVQEQDIEFIKKKYKTPFEETFEKQGLSAFESIWRKAEKNLPQNMMQPSDGKM